MNKLLQEIDELKKKLDEIRPLLGGRVQEALDIEYTYESNRIEGNTLTLRETDLVINKGLTIGGKSMQEHLEAINHYEAIHYIRDLVKNKIQLTEKVIKEIHAIILRGIDRDNAGKYRNIPVAISGSKFTPPQPYIVPKLMEEYGFWLGSEATALHPVMYAAEAHERLVSIHPFIDGNGRTSRLVMNLVLLQKGYLIANIPGDTESRLTYYSALEKCNLQNNKTDFLKLIAGIVLKNLRELLERIGNNP